MESEFFVVEVETDRDTRCLIKHTASDFYTFVDVPYLATTFAQRYDAELFGWHYTQQIEKHDEVKVVKCKESEVEGAESFVCSEEPPTQ